MRVRSLPLREFLLALLGPAVWAGHFFVVYGLEAAVCTRAASPVPAMQWIVLSATAVSIAVLVALWIFAQRSMRSVPLDFLRRITGWLALISTGAVLAVASSALALKACVPPAG